MDFSVDVKQQELIDLAKTKAESWMKSCWRF